METEEIRQGNKIIDDFLGWKLIDINDKRDRADPDEYGIWQFQRYKDGEVIEVDCGGDSWSWDKGDQHRYHSDWNLLMEFVVFIQKMNFTVLIGNESCAISAGWHPSQWNINFKEETTQKAVWKACISFVQWQNSLSKKELKPIVMPVAEPSLCGVYFGVYIDGEYKQIVSVRADSEEQAEKKLIDAGWSGPVRFKQMVFNIDDICVVFNGK